MYYKIKLEKTEDLSSIAINMCNIAMIPSIRMSVRHRSKSNKKKWVRSG